MFPILLMFLGEFLIIYAENYAAKNSSVVWTFEQWIFFIVLITISGFSLVFAYKIGYQEFQNIWVVVAISIGSIVLVEPLVSWYMFHELPSTGALIGCGLGMIGMLIATLWK